MTSEPFQPSRTSTDSYVPALRFAALTRWYDVVIRTLVREATFRERLLAAGDVRAGNAALDIGCGTGSFLALLHARHPEARAFGIDPDPGALRLAATKLPRNVELREASATDLPHRGDTFDRVFSSLMFHHLPRSAKIAALAEALRVLRPGGELHVADWGPPANPLLAVAFGVLRLFDGIDNTRENARGELPLMIAAAGFTGVRAAGTVNTVFGTMHFLSARKPEA